MEGATLGGLRIGGFRDDALDVLLGNVINRSGEVLLSCRLWPRRVSPIAPNECPRSSGGRPKELRDLSPDMSPRGLEEGGVAKPNPESS